MSVNVYIYYLFMFIQKKREKYFTSVFMNVFTIIKKIINK
jgi:hypothetical protein